MKLIHGIDHVKAGVCLAAALMILNLSGCTVLPNNQSIREGFGNLAADRISGKNSSGESTESRTDGADKSSAKSNSNKSGGALPKKEERGPAIIEAVQNGDYDTLEQLLSDVDDVRPLVPEGTLLLHMAEEGMAGGGMANPVTELLVEKKAWILQRDSRGRGAHYVLYDYELFGTPRGDYLDSVIGGAFSAYYKAVNSDSPVEIKKFSDQLPMDQYVMFDALQRQKAVAVASYALEQGAPAQAVLEESGENLLHLLCSDVPSRGTPFSAREDLAKKLIAGGADTNGLSKRGDTPLYYLVKSASKDFNGYLGDCAGLVRVLLEADSDPNAPCSHWDGTSMLYTAVSNRMDDVAELLLEYGAVVDDQAASAPNASDRAKAMMAKYKK